MARVGYNSAKNIIVGASPLWINKTDVDLDPTKAVSPAHAFVTGTSYAATLDAATANWRNVGYTNNGLQITYNPSYGSVTVDQLLDAAQLFKESMEVMLATEFAEATLENLVAVWGQPVAASTTSISDTSTLTTAEPTATTPQQLGMSAGRFLQEPVERQLCAVGAAPDYSGGSTNAGYTRNERVYFARRAVSMQQTQFSLQRAGASTFPVTFRLLPSGDAAHVGAEYGKIIDRIYT